MRIVQLSDIHLSSSNLSELTNYYEENLSRDLLERNAEKPIDVVLITGDLVDKGGSSLGNEPYQIFKNRFLVPIQEKLGLPNKKILFIPGNHDINREEIDEDNEYRLSETLDVKGANYLLDGQSQTYTRANQRIKKFKTFEGDFHNGHSDYEFSFNQSTSIQQYKSFNVGFALINDSWRCSQHLKQEQHFIGSSQLFKADKYFENHATTVNIAVFHHPLEVLNSKERESIENILQSRNYQVAFFGHNHLHKFESVLSAKGGLISIQGRSAFSDPEQSDSRYQPGYNILDIELHNLKYTLRARKFIYNGFRFDDDVDALSGGKISGYLTKSTNVQIPGGSNESVNEKTNSLELPTRYSADITKVVKLLIGKSLYPDDTVFIRELLQNSVDACKRIQVLQPLKTPSIIVNINSVDNSFEVVDEGDGMTKRIIREHFAVVGKSISQEYLDELKKVNLISKFGIGFISTFNAAKEVYISSITKEDGPVHFRIQSVFSDFEYFPNSTSNSFHSLETGTSVKVYMRDDLKAGSMLSYCKNYLRHISNIKIYLNGSLENHTESWNTDGGCFNFHILNDRYECKLTIGTEERTLIASNTGFLIDKNANSIIPYRFPGLIGGEVNFQASEIELDMSRTKILDTHKATLFRREMSVCVKNLFRQVIDSNNLELKNYVSTYLQFYLVNYNQNQNEISQSYLDFYTKPELSSLCSDLIYLDFRGRSTKLSEIIFTLKQSGINSIYYDNSHQTSELNLIVQRYLSGNGNLVVSITRQVASNAIFRGEQWSISVIETLKIIAPLSGLTCIEVSSISSVILPQMKKVKSTLPSLIIEAISLIERNSNISIEFAHFGSDIKPAIKFQNGYFINLDNTVIVDLFSRHTKVPINQLHAYLAGTISVILPTI